MSRPKLLDCFCCEGGAAMGYSRAGFDVYGVDIDSQPRYPFAFARDDALDVLRALIRGRGVDFNSRGSGRETLALTDFSAVHASPPCQAHSTITPDKSKHVDLIPPTRALLQKLTVPWVMENVEGAKTALIHPMRLCGSSFGLRVRRHRYFESNTWLTSMPCRHAEQGEPVGVYGDHADGVTRRPNGTSRGVKAQTVAEAQEAMGMPWASWHGATQAIPPAYTEWIGAQLLDQIGVAA